MTSHLPFFSVPRVDDSPPSFLCLVPSSLSVLYLKGCVRLRSVVGVADVHGWREHQDDSEIELFSPRGYSLTKIRLTPRENKEDEEVVLEAAVKGLNFDFKTMKSILRAWNEGECVAAILLTKLSPSWYPALKSLLPIIDAASASANLLGRDSNLTQSASEMEKVLDVNLVPEEAAFASGARLFQEGQEWDLAVQNVRITMTKGSKVCMLGVGGKGVGKSTFLKYVANRVIKETGKPVVFMDLDPGQAEFTLPGCVGATLLREPVFGPNYCHLDRDTRHVSFLGDVSMSNCKGRYLRAMEALWAAVQTDPDFKGLPVLINSMGFTRGLGEVFIQKTIARVKPSAVVCLRSRFHAKNYAVDFRSSHHVYLEFGAVPESSEVRSMRASDTWGTPHPRVLRDTVVATKLARLRDGVGCGGRFYELPLSPPRVAFQILHNEVPVRHSEILHLFNGSLVALCVMPKKELERAREAQGITRVSPNAEGVCLGFGIVQCACDANQRLVLLTDVDEETMSRVNCLSMGAVRLPEAFYLSQKEAAKAPYVTERLPEEEPNPLADAWIRQSKPKNIF